MERVTNESDVCGRVLGLLAGAYLTGAEAMRVRCAVAEAETRGARRQMESERRAVERVRQKLAAFRDRAAPGVEPPRPWAPEEIEEEAVLQGQDGPDPEYVVAPRFGGVNLGGSTRVSGPGISYEVPTAEDAPLSLFAAPRPGGLAPRFGGVELRRSTPADPFEGFPDLPPGADALAPLYAIQAAEAALTEADRCPLTGDAPADPDADDDGDDTPLVVPPFTDEQEGE